VFGDDGEVSRVAIDFAFIVRIAEKRGRGREYFRQGLRTFRDIFLVVFSDKPTDLIAP
jgi:hypothetical protein